MEIYALGFVFYFYIKLVDFLVSLCIGLCEIFLLTQNQGKLDQIEIQNDLYIFFSERCH